MDCTGLLKGFGAQAKLRPAGAAGQALQRAFFLSIPLSIDPDIIRHPEGPTTEDHAVRQRFIVFLLDFLLPFGRLIMREVGSSTPPRPMEFRGLEILAQIQNLILRLRCGLRSRL